MGPRTILFYEDYAELSIANRLLFVYCDFLYFTILGLSGVDLLMNSPCRFSEMWHLIF